MKRRSFLQAGTAVTLPVLVNGFNLGLLPRSALFSSIGADSDKILVIIQLDGGNDGLATLIPLDQYDTLAPHRAGMLIPEQSVLPLYDHVGLHPSMTGMRNLFNDGKLAAIQGVAYPGQNRSHFRSTDIWQSASASNVFESTGWMGRYFDDQFPGYPEDYPNEDYPDPFAITLQYTVSETCQGASSNYSMALTDPFNLSQIDEATINELPDTNYGFEMSFLIDAIAQTNAYSSTILDAANLGNNLSPLYDDANPLAQQLKTVALLISGGLKTRTYVVRIGGFDTHANQVQPGDVTNGNHATLLGRLSGAIEAFQDDLKRMGLEEQVLGMTFSEFGRQIGGNDSFGTDHGTAAPMFLFGSCVKGGIFGENPTINAQLQPQEGVAMQYDFRNIYASVFRDWWKADDALIDTLLSGEFNELSLIDACEATAVDTPPIKIKPYIFNVYPNPVSGTANIEFQGDGDRVRITLLDNSGREVKLIADQEFASGTHTIPFSASDLGGGSYFVRAVGNKGVASELLIKQ